MSTGGFGAYPEHHFRRVIPGDVATVRTRLCDVLEDFNYIVLSDTPIQAKRDKTRNVWVSTMLDCDARLTIGLKAISPVSTLATFDYAVPYLFTHGDMQALEREAEAIIALAARPLNQTICPSCGTENGGAVRFCRSCGAPVARNKLPGEIEIMRLTAGVSSSQQEIILGLVIALLSVVVTLPMIQSSHAKLVIAGWVLLSLGGLQGLIFLLTGLKRLQRTLHPKSSSQEIEADVQPAVSADDRIGIAGQPSSVTEGTTSLMEPPECRPGSAQQGKKTDPIQ
jgi:ribosomal protein L40E